MKWRKRYKCKKNKGEHKFEIKTVRAYRWFQGERDGYKYSSVHPSNTDTHTTCPVMVKWHCVSCNKHELEWFGHDLFTDEKGHKKFDPYRKTMYTALSYNGSTPAFEAENVGSIPTEAT